MSDIPHTPDATTYQRIIELIFHERYDGESDRIEFERETLVRAADRLGVDRPKNLGDVIYSFTAHRQPLPATIRETAPEGEVWTLAQAGRSRYAFELRPEEAVEVTPSEGRAVTKVPDATPGIIARYALTDEQALLAVLRYNRLIDIFTGVTCYSLQNHLRTQLEGVGQTETDELYVGVDRAGIHYAFPVEAKGGEERLNTNQIRKNFALCEEKFPELVCRPIAAQFVGEERIALFEFERGEHGAALYSERHYQLVGPDELSADELRDYRDRLTEAARD